MLTVYLFTGHYSQSLSAPNETTILPVLYVSRCYSTSTGTVLCPGSPRCLFTGTVLYPSRVPHGREHHANRDARNSRSLAGYPLQLRQDGKRWMPNDVAVIRSVFWSRHPALAASSFSAQVTVLEKGSAYRNVCTRLGSTWSYSSLSDGAATSSGRHPGQRCLVGSCICQ